MADFPYFSFEALEDRLSKAVVRRIYDDNNDGEPDTNPLLRLMKDAGQRYETVMAGIYPSIASLRVPAAADAASGLVLDLAEAMAAKRFPRAINREWQPLLKDAMDQISEYRKGFARIPVDGAPNPPANAGGDISSGAGSSVADDDIPEPLFQGDW
jgi:hypothetical protein